MSNIEDIVSPLEMCQLIPDGCFEKSVFGWRYTPRVGQGDFDWTVVIRDSNDVDCPAPTLQEILAEIPDVTLNYDGRGRWAVQAILPSRAYGDCNANPATVALKLWLELNERN